ncbi:MAG: hypothetical protein JRG80_12040 [Deltaproteobacteria bacterium]|nr:hypothetical protein [Deltaproteobacteria bacterium]MBW2399987.1 hypothetical protein [Deltaproteobacteria bacterium]
MDPNSVLQWFQHHPNAIHTDPAEIVARCERAVRRHAQEDAWLSAKAYVARRRHAWEQTPGLHASEVYTAREVCHEIASGLRDHEPTVESKDADHLAGGPVRDSVDDRGWELLTRWILDLAREEEHATWLEIVSHTDHMAPELIRDEHLSEDCSHEGSACFGQVAVRIAKLLEHDYSIHAFPH